jgi:hypothetical protein
MDLMKSPHPNRLLVKPVRGNKKHFLADDFIKRKNPMAHAAGHASVGFWFASALFIGSVFIRVIRKIRGLKSSPQLGCGDRQYGICVVQTHLWICG